MSSSRWKALAVVATVGTLALAGCANNNTGAGGSTAGSAAGSGSPDLTIMVGGMSKQIYLPYMLAQQLGYYDKAGVKVSLIDEPAGGDATTNMLAGQVQG
ncbi:ABC transporter substrate-binding protein, partial [Mycobacterium sp.]|nr:transporter substrate-binding protein [Mycobacterium sp.]